MNRKDDPQTSVCPGRKNHMGRQDQNSPAPPPRHPTAPGDQWGWCRQPSILKACPSAQNGEWTWLCHVSESPFKALKTSCPEIKSSDTPVPRADEHVLFLGHLLSLIGMQDMSELSLSSPLSVPCLPPSLSPPSPTPVPKQLEWP